VTKPEHQSAPKAAAAPAVAAAPAPNPKPADVAVTEGYSVAIFKQGASDLLAGLVRFVQPWADLWGDHPPLSREAIHKTMKRFIGPPPAMSAWNARADEALKRWLHDLIVYYRRYWLLRGEELEARLREHLWQYEMSNPVTDEKKLSPMQRREIQNRNRPRIRTALEPFKPPSYPWRQV
jgi:hypothetical protein